MPASKKTAAINLSRMDCTNPGKGPWRMFPDLAARSVNLKHTKSGFVHRVYFGTRTERTEEDATVQATALCAILNALGAKRP